MVGKVTAQNKTEWNDFQTTHGKRTLVPLSWRRGPDRLELRTPVSENECDEYPGLGKQSRKSSPCGQLELLLAPPFSPLVSLPGCCSSFSPGPWPPLCQPLPVQHLSPQGPVLS